MLGSENSKVIGTIVDEKEYTLISVDSDSLIRVWNIDTGECIRSYLIE